MFLNFLVSLAANARRVITAAVVGAGPGWTPSALPQASARDAAATGALALLPSGVALPLPSGSRAHAAATRLHLARLVAGIVVNAIFIALALAYTLGTTAFGCSGGFSSGGGTTPPNDPNRALGTYRVSDSFNDAESRIFFGYWFTGENDISIAAAQAFRAAMLPIENTALITIAPSSILYEETAVALDTGQLVTVSISGTWVYDSQTSIKVDWGSAFVTASTFPPTPPFDVATVGTLLDGPIPSDIIFAENAKWIELLSVEPGPLDGVFVRDAS